LDLAPLSARSTPNPTDPEIDMRRSLAVLRSTTLALALAGCVNPQVRAARDAAEAPAAAATPAVATGGSARADLRNAQGVLVGTVTLQQAAQGLLLTVDVANLPPGTHGMHIHAVGRCDPPGFESAGGHFNPTGRQHGARNEMGQHAGDLPNLQVPASGSMRVDIVARELTLGSTGTGMFDADGSAIVVHALADDYRTDPSGASGDRIACGVVSR
jgi:Cu-Zn family superoxide dismutase